MEACCGARYLGRNWLTQGLDAKLMPPTYVNRFVQREESLDPGLPGSGAIIRAVEEQ